MQVDVELHAEDLMTDVPQLCTRGRFVMIALDAAGHPDAVPALAALSPS